MGIDGLMKQLYVYNIENFYTPASFICICQEWFFLLIVA